MKQFLCLLAAVAAVSLGIGVALASGPIAVFALVFGYVVRPVRVCATLLLATGMAWFFLRLRS